MNTTKKLLIALSIIAPSLLPLAAHASILGIATTGDLSKIQAEIDTMQSEINTIQNQVEGLQSFGDTINQSPALFETSLASAINSSQNSMTLVSGSLRDGTTLSGNYCFTIDSGLTTTEYVCGVASGTAVTALTRGIGSDGITSFGSLEYPHRYGADVKITDFPQLQQQTRLLNGQGTFPNILSYSSSTPTSTVGSNIYNIPNVGYVNSVASSGAPDANPGIKGLVQIITPGSPATSTDGGQTLYGVISKQYYATSTYGPTTTVIMANNGALDNSWISASSSGPYNESSTWNFQATTTAPYLVPPGAIEAYVSSTAPMGWLSCNGQSVSTTTYSNLFSVIGYGYGGSTSTFSIPNLGGRFLAGASSSLSSTIGAVGGATTSTFIAQTSVTNNNYGQTGGNESVVSAAGGVTTTAAIIPPYFIVNYIIKF